MHIFIKTAKESEQRLEEEEEDWLQSNGNSLGPRNNRGTIGGPRLTGYQTNGIRFALPGAQVISPHFRSH